MTREEAKKVLIDCRLTTANQTDAAVLEALKLAASDSELNQWLNEQQEFHRVVREQLRAIPAPEGLKDRILAQKPIVVSFWRRREVVAMAASAALLLAGLLYWLKPAADEPTFANFSSRMTSFVLLTYRMDIRTNNATVVRNFLASKGAPANFPLPPKLETLPVKGGGKLTWQNHPVSMMCFGLPKNQTAFMFVLDQTSVRGGVPPAEAQITPGKNLSAVAWTRGNKLYYLAAGIPPEDLAALATQAP